MPIGWELAHIYYILVWAILKCYSDPMEEIPHKGGVNHDDKSEEIIRKLRMLLWICMKNV